MNALFQVSDIASGAFAGRTVTVKAFGGKDLDLVEACHRDGLLPGFARGSLDLVDVEYVGDGRVTLSHEGEVLAVAQEI